MGDKIKGFLNEFREFAMRGNVIDMAIGVVIGTAFGKISASLVSDVIMPPLGILIGKVDFKDLKLTLVAAADNAPAVTLNYGSFVQEVFNFLIIAFAMFIVVRVMNTLKRKQKDAEVPSASVVPSRQEVLLEEIRDLLKGHK